MSCVVRVFITKIALNRDSPTPRILAYTDFKVGLKSVGVRGSRSPKYCKAVDFNGLQQFIRVSFSR